MTQFLTGILLMTALAAPARSADFVKVRGTRFELQGRPYYFLGTNLWAGMNLGSRGPGGDRGRLRRELDRLHALGVDNLRVIAASEGPDSAPWRIVPALQKTPGVYDQDLLDGLDYLLFEMGKRGMKAVVVLNDFWHWSGGMAQYVAWSQKTSIPYPPPAAGGDWDTFVAKVRLPTITTVSAASFLASAPVTPESIAERQYRMLGDIGWGAWAATAAAKAR